MKYLLAALVMTILFWSHAEAKTYLTLEGNVIKQTNGSYVWNLPYFEYEWAKTPVVLVTVLKANFTSPRSSIGSINHHSVDLEQEFGLWEGPYYGTFSVGFRYNFLGNSDGNDQGFEFLNTLRVGTYLEFD